MAQWKRRAVGDLPIHQATTLTWLPGVVQGFTTRQGGVSKPPYDTLNLGGHVGDAPAEVQANRQRLWADIGCRENQVAFAEQVHGSAVATVTTGGPPVLGADALVTDTPDVLLMMLYADCVPIYLVDPVARAVGLIHSGWRGTVAGIVGNTMRTMQEQFGSRPESCLAAVGPCIGGESYEVGRDVADQFRGMISLSSANALFPRDEFAGTYSLNLRQIIFAQLLSVGFRAEYVNVSPEDTFRNKRDFFSYRRDGKQTGRMAAFLALRSI